MLNNIASYIGGKTGEKEEFQSNSESFGMYLEKLRPLEQKENEIDTLTKVKSLYVKIEKRAEEIFLKYDRWCSKTGLF
jgi:hypothetical protein